MFKKLEAFAKKTANSVRSFKPQRTNGLDLSYVPSPEPTVVHTLETKTTYLDGAPTKRIIAMCLPVDKNLVTFLKGGIIRNSAEDVSSFLHLRHGDRFKVYTLLEEPLSEEIQAHFDNRVRHFAIDDHNVPTFQQMMEFCQDVKAVSSSSSESPRDVLE